MRFLFFYIYFLIFFAFTLAQGYQMERAIRIVGGTEASPHQYKSIISTNYGCGGTLITPTWVLTAAHCIDGLTPENYLVAGDHNMKVDEKSEQRLQIKQSFVHEKFGEGDAHANDIALIEVTPPVKMTTFVETAMVPPEGYTASGYAAAVGWGVLQYQGTSPPALQHVRLPVIPLDECRSKLLALTPPYGLPNGSLCTLYPGGSKDACQGDSGGPLYAEDLSLPKGKRLVIGVVSWGEGCARPEHPAVYTNVSYFIPWIESKIGKGFLEFYKPNAKPPKQPDQNIYGGSENSEEDYYYYDNYDNYDDYDNYGDEYDYNRK